MLLSRSAPVKALTARVGARIPAPVKTLSLKAGLALPERVLRGLAGRPVVLQGLTLDLEQQFVLRMLELTGEPVLGAQAVPEGRVVMRQQARMAAGNLPIGSVTEVQVAGRPARLYVPRADTGEPAALLVYIHGGGWTYGDLDTHDGPCRSLAEQAGVRVLSIDYRLAPEHPFPAAYDDCVAAYRWVVENAASLGADPTRLAVGGDSAGGNLAAGVALAAAEQGLPLAFQLLIYPATEFDADTGSQRTFDQGFYLTRVMMDRCRDGYVPGEDQRRDPRASPLLAEIPAGVAPAYVCTAGFDPLRDEGEAYAAKLRAAGVTVEQERFDGQIHGFINFTGVGRSGPAAVAAVAAALKAGLTP